MTVKKKMNTALSALGVPYSYMYYTGKDETFIVGQITNTSVSGRADDKVFMEDSLVKVNIYTKKDYEKLTTKVIEALHKEGFDYESTNEYFDFTNKVFQITVDFIYKNQK